MNKKSRTSRIYVYCETLTNMSPIFFFFKHSSQISSLFIKNPTDYLVIQRYHFYNRNIFLMFFFKLINLCTRSDIIYK